MINFTRQTHHLAKTILEHISYSQLAITKTTNRLNPFICNPLELLHSFGRIRPGQADFIFLDLPRASANGDIDLFSLDNDEAVITRSFKFDDTDYQTTLAANFLVIARLARQSLSQRGVLGLTSNWQHYLIL